MHRWLAATHRARFCISHVHCRSGGRGAPFPERFCTSGARTVILGVLETPSLSRHRLRQFQEAGGPLPEVASTAERAEIVRLRKEVAAELERVNEILKAASVFSRASSTQTGRSERVYRQLR